jgi:hypothetical protein
VPPVVSIIVDHLTRLSWSAAAGILVVALLAGCLAGSVEGPPSVAREVPVSLPFEVERGTWSLYEPTEAGPARWHADLRTTYAAPRVATQDSFDCAVAGVHMGDQTGWIANFGATQSLSAREQVGYRNAMSNGWASYHQSDADTDAGVNVMMGSDRDKPAMVLLAYDVHGPDVDSHLHVRSEDAFMISGQGRAWCLSGVPRYEGGSYVMTRQHVDARDLTWSATVDGGLMLRLVTTVTDLEMRLEGPDGQHYPLPVSDVPQDTTFCRSESGRWTIVVDKLRSPHAASWQFDVMVLGGVPPIVACGAGWQPSPIVETVLD